MALSSQPQGTLSFDILPSELQQEVFNHLEGHNVSLFAVIQVSKAWHECCIGMLWRKSTQRILAKISTQERRQYYANMIHRWLLNEASTWKLFDGLDFPLLKDLSILGGCLSEMQLRHCLQRGLHTLRYIQGVLDAAMLEMIATCCTQLERLIIAHPDASAVTPDQFMTFIQSLPALRRLQIGYVPVEIAKSMFGWDGRSVTQLEKLSVSENWYLANNFALLRQLLKHFRGLRKLYLVLEDVLPINTLVQVMSSPLLEVLRVEDVLADGDGLQQQFISATSVANSFPSIKDLSMSSRASTITALLSSSPSTLVSLDLRVTNDSHSVCSTISRCTHLLRLEIVFNGYSELSHTELDYISELSSLQKCHVEWRGPSHTRYGSNECQWLTDTFFENWITKLPQLRDLILVPGSYNITPRSLRFLADSCPLLSNVELMWMHNLIEWTSLEAPLFPDLKRMHLGIVDGWHYTGSRTTTDMILSKDLEVIRSLAPNLESFSVGRPFYSGYNLVELTPYEEDLEAAFLATL
jgi:hypothetical protein